MTKVHAMPLNREVLTTIWSTIHRLYRTLQIQQWEKSQPFDRVLHDEQIKGSEKNEVRKVQEQGQLEELRRVCYGKKISSTTITQNEGASTEQVLE